MCLYLLIGTPSYGKNLSYIRKKLKYCQRPNKKRSIPVLRYASFLFEFIRISRREVRGLPTTVTGQNRQHIGHHRDCDDEQFDRYLLHDITSFKMDLWVGN